MYCPLWGLIYRSYRAKIPQAAPIFPPAASLAFTLRWREVRSGSASTGTALPRPKSQV